ncbi:hypothetical protein DPMN_117236 [Dreissena polymorpha]|uniref:Uncharacterized protein n=1 Tax=Dreissena polymorpha TaxID=45954 RepID=A0A9D4QV06_DREPO|nr:hypothetical protein DPMN_117236 [Dreissena polymorpha]
MSQSLETCHSCSQSSGGASHSTSIIIGAKVKVTHCGQRALSIRPENFYVQKHIGGGYQVNEFACSSEDQRDDSPVAWNTGILLLGLLLKAEMIKKCQ